MLSNLKIYTNNFKKKLMYTTAVLVIGSSVLSGCSVLNEEKTDEASKDDPYKLEITLNINGYEDLSDKDLLIVYDDNNTIYNAVDVDVDADADADNDIKTILVYPESLGNLNISSDVLDTSIDLPSITNDETYEVNIDYDTKTYDVEVVEKQEEKGMSK